MVEYGVIKFFNPIKGYGYVSITHGDAGELTGDDVYFRHETGHTVIWDARDDAPRFGLQHGSLDDGTPVTTPTPHKNMRVVFVRSTASERRCTRWAYAEPWRHAQRTIQNMPMLRLVTLQDGEVVAKLWTGAANMKGIGQLRQISLLVPRTGEDPMSRAYAPAGRGSVLGLTDGLVIQAKSHKSGAPMSASSWFTYSDRRAPADCIPADRWSLTEQPLKL